MVIETSWHDPQILNTVHSWKCLSEIIICMHNAYVYNRYIFDEKPMEFRGGIDPSAWRLSPWSITGLLLLYLCIFVYLCWQPRRNLSMIFTATICGWHCMILWHTVNCVDIDIYVYFHQFQWFTSIQFMFTSTSFDLFTPKHYIIYLNIYYIYKYIYKCISIYMHIVHTTSYNKSRNV